MEMKTTESLIGKTAIFRNPLYPSLDGKRCVIVDDITGLIKRENMPPSCWPLVVRIGKGAPMSVRLEELEIL